MMRLFARFRRLRWKLAFSYALVTVGTLLALESIVVAIVLAAVFGTNALPQGFAQVLIRAAAQDLSPAFAGDQPDLAAIHAWLQRSTSEGIRLQEDTQTYQIGREIFDGGARLLVLDASGRLLGAADQPTPPAAPAPFDVASIPGLAPLLPRALAGEQDAGRLYAHSNWLQLTVATPIRDPAGRVRGAVVLSRPFSLRDFPYRDVAAALGVSLVFFAIGSGLIGTVFGFFTARGLTRRLARMSTTAAAWGAGDFSPVIKDRSQDEIGQLSRRLNRMAAQLHELIETRQQLSVVDERNRLARDLHDSVKQHVFAISMNLGAARALWDQDPAAARQRLDAAFELARQSQQELTTIIQTLRPVELEGKGVRQALREYLARWQEQSRIATSYETEGDGQLPLRVEDALFRVTQEALANVARHSRAPAVRVALRSRPGEVELEVSDSGQGFDQQRRATGVGLQSMRERVEAVGGTLAVTSGAGGTTLLARVPLPDEGERG